MDIGREMLELIDYLNSKKDTEGLGLVHTLLAQLSMQGVADAKTSFVDLAEYTESLIRDTQNNLDEQSDTVGLRKLIDSDLDT